MDRNRLHALVDTLPEGALETAQGALENLQVWPPPGRDPVFEEALKRHQERALASRRPGGGGGGGGGGISRPGGYAHYGFSRVEGETSVVEKTHVHRGREVRVLEKLWLEGGTLVHTQRITGPDGQTVEATHRFEAPGK